MLEWIPGTGVWNFGREEIHSKNVMFVILKRNDTHMSHISVSRYWCLILVYKYYKLYELVFYCVLISGRKNWYIFFSTKNINSVL